MSKSQIIYQGAHYTACEMRDGSLIITSNRRQKGVRLVGAEADQWGDAIRTALDGSEAHALCREVIGA